MKAYNFSQLDINWLTPALSWNLLFQINHLYLRPLPTPLLSSLLIFQLPELGTGKSISNLEPGKYKGKQVILHFYEYFEARIVWKNGLSQRHNQSTNVTH